MLILAVRQNKILIKKMRSTRIILSDSFKILIKEMSVQDSRSFEGPVKLHDPIAGRIELRPVL